MVGRGRRFFVSWLDAISGAMLTACYMFPAGHTGQHYRSRKHFYGNLGENSRSEQEKDKEDTQLQLLPIWKKPSVQFLPGILFTLC